MQFKAREVYKDSNVVKDYDKKRFTSVKGWLTDFLEKRCVSKGLDLLNLKKGSKILDIPSGTGRLSLYLVLKDFIVSGVDISAAMVKSAQDKFAIFNVSGKADFRVADAERLPFANSTFDSVVSLRLFGHVPPPIRINMLKEFARVSRGYIIAAYYMKNSLQCYLRKSKRINDGTPWYPVSLKGIEDELKEAGYEMVKYFPVALGVSETVIVVGKALE